MLRLARVLAFPAVLHFVVAALTPAHATPARVQLAAEPSPPGTVAPTTLRGTPPPLAFGWSDVPIQSAGNVGAMISAVRDAFGQVHVSFYDGDTADLRYAVSTPSGWFVETVNPTPSTDDGNLSAIAVFDGFPRICHYDQTQSTLRYVEWDGGAWLQQNVHSMGSPGVFGQTVAMAVDPFGFAHVAYYDVTQQSLNYAQGDLGGFFFNQVDPRITWDSAIAISQLSGLPRIVYTTDSFEVFLAEFDGVLWSIEFVDVVSCLGCGVSIAIDSFDQTHVAYRAGHGSVNHAVRTGTGWNIETPDGSASQTAPSLQLDDADVPYLAYSENSQSLVLASKAPGFWTTEIVGPMEPVIFAGNNTALVFPPTGEPDPGIAYHNTSSADARFASPTLLDLLGDVTGDGLVDVGDAARLLRVIAGNEPGTARDSTLGDLFPTGGDGLLTLADFIPLFQLASGLIDGASFGFPSVTSTIDPAGGELHHPHGASLIVPPGAVAHPTDFTITRTTPVPVGDEEETLIGETFLLEPACVFEEDCFFQLPYDPTQLPGAHAQVSAVTRGHAEIDPQGTLPNDVVNQHFRGTAEARYYPSTVDSARFRVVVPVRTIPRDPLTAVWDPLAPYEEEPPAFSRGQNKTVRITWRSSDDDCNALKARIKAAVDSTMKALQDCGIPFCAPNEPYPLTITLRNHSNPDGSTQAFHRAGSLTFYCNRIDTEGTPSELEKTASHELTHLFQYFLSNRKTQKCEDNEWWVEGTAEAFCDKVYDGVEGDYHCNGRNHVTDPKTQEYHASVFVKWLMAKKKGYIEETYKRLKALARDENENNKEKEDKIKLCDILNAVVADSLGKGMTYADLLPDYYGDLLGNRDWDNDETLGDGSGAEGDLWKEYPKDPTKWAINDAANITLQDTGYWGTLGPLPINSKAATVVSFRAGAATEGSLEVSIVGQPNCPVPDADNKCLEIRCYGQKVAGGQMVPVLRATRPQGSNATVTVGDFHQGGDNEYVHVVVINRCCRRVGRTPGGKNLFVIRGDYKP